MGEVSLTGQDRALAGLVIQISGVGYWYEIMDRCGVLDIVCCGLIIGWSLT